MFLVNHLKIGKIGEDLACDYLKEKGFLVVNRNFRKKCGEIDIVAKKQGKHHFVEVKTVSCENVTSFARRSNYYRPEDNIHSYKIARLRRVIQLYLIENYVKTDWQFHAITILYSPINNESRIEMLENLVL